MRTGDQHVWEMTDGVSGNALTTAQDTRVVAGS